MARGARWSAAAMAALVLAGCGAGYDSDTPRTTSTTVPTHIPTGTLDSGIEGLPVPKEAVLQPGADTPGSGFESRRWELRGFTHDQVVAYLRDQLPFKAAWRDWKWCAGDDDHRWFWFKANADGEVVQIGVQTSTMSETTQDYTVTRLADQPAERCNGGSGLDP